MQRLEVSGAVRPIYGSLGVERLRKNHTDAHIWRFCAFPSTTKRKSSCERYEIV